MSEKIKIICVVGPTASGKTGLGVKIAKLVGGEVISADSMQIYKDMHIASAAADESEKEGIPHHLLEFVPYGTAFTVYDYLKCAREKIAETVSRGKVPVIVGGTGLYINSLVDNIELSEVGADLMLRREIEKRYDAAGGERMLEELRKVDPDSAANLHANDRRRIVRALEIYESTGMTKSEQDIASRTSESPYDALIIGINYSDRQKLYERIDRRVDIMAENGLTEEAKAAYDRRNDISGGAVQAIGHKEFFPYFEGKISLFDVVETLKKQTRHYAKRQLTWFRARNDVNWIYPDTEDITEKTRILLESRGYEIEGK